MIVVGTTLASFAMLDHERDFLWEAWLYNAEAIRDSVDDEVRFFAAIQVDARGLDPFKPLIARLEELGGEYWTYSLDDGRTSVHTNNRLRHITMGQNLISEYANSVGASHLLHMAADCCPPEDVLPKLLAVSADVVAAEIPTYCFNEPLLPQYSFPVTLPPISVACVLIERDTFKRLRWRYDTDLGMSDDPAYTLDTNELLSGTVLLRKDCVARHYPEAIGPIETRFDGLDMSVQH